MDNHLKTTKQKVILILQWIGVAFYAIILAGILTCVFLYGAGVFNG